jgi:2-amino-4-hydroxy-6-hydroxymethyldihydropteridine diphosphokinase
VPEVDVFIALGSNLNPILHIPQALELLADHAPITGLSRLYLTDPVGPTRQPDFVNGVVRIRTSLPPLALKQQVLRKIEAQLGRTRGEDKFAPRTIDLDILLYGDLEMNTPDLRLPDPEILERAFIARGLLDIDPALVLPGSSAKLASVPPRLKGALVLLRFTEILHARHGVSAKP